METPAIDSARKLSDDANLAAMMVLYCSIQNIHNSGIVSNYKNAIEMEHKAYDEVPLEEINTYFDCYDKPKSDFLGPERRVFYRLMELKYRIENPDGLYDGYSLSTIFTAKLFIDGIKDSYECLKLSKRNGDFDKKELDLFDLSRVAQLYHILESSSLVEDIFIESNFDIDQMQRISFRDIEEKTGVSFVDIDQDILVNFEQIILNYIASYKVDEKLAHLQSQALAIYLSNFNSILECLNKESLGKLSNTFPVATNAATKEVLKRARELYIDRRRKFE